MYDSKNTTVLINGWGENLIKILEKYSPKVSIVSLHDDLWYTWNDFSTWNLIYKETNIKKYDIVHMNSRFDSILFFKRKNIKYIFESHAIHPWISIKYSLLITESFFKKIIIILAYPLFKLCFLYNIRRIDLYYVSIPWIAAFLDGKYQVKWLPNPVDFSNFYCKAPALKLDKIFINIFYPTGFRKIKNSEFALQLMIQLQHRYPNIRFYLIKTHTKHLTSYFPLLKKLEKNIVWIDKIPREKMAEWYSANWDCIFGSFFPDEYYAILNMIELEAMACKAPVLGHDLYEVLFEPLENMFPLACKLIDDKEFRAQYIKRNYEYVMKVHSPESVAKKYEEDIMQLFASHKS